MNINFSNVRVTENIQEANCITHSGTFHADEIFATLILSIIKENIVVYRTSEVNDEMKNSNCIIYDVGRGELDHHQKGGNGTRENGLMYASCGLVWKKYHKEVFKRLNVEEKDWDYLYNQIDKNLIQFIDANDNGLTPDIGVDYKYVTIASIVASFNPRWDEDMAISNNRFIDAMDVCKKVLENEILSQISKLKAKDKVEEAIQNSKNHILILEEYMPWQDFVLSSESDKAKDLWYAIYPSKRGGYALHCVVKKLGSFENRKSLPLEWAGLENEKLQEVTGVADARFCHTARFLATTDTYEAAIKLAELAVNNRGE